MGQDGSKITSKRRVQDGEKVKLLSKENRAALKLSASEIKTLRQLYHRLAALSPENEYIDKQTFLNYFPLEGVLAERLFATFDKDRNNVIDYEEFLGGLALCLCGTVDEKFQLVFDLYNIDDGDGVSEEELAVVLKSTFIAATAIVNPVTNILIGECNQPFDIDQHVQNVVKDAFEQCDTSQTGKLSPEEFRTWAEYHPYILDIIFGHKSFTDKQLISENITAATMKAVEMNSLKYQSQTWVDSPIPSEEPEETSRDYAKATYLWSPVFPVMLRVPRARSEHTVCVYQGVLYLLGGRGTTAYKDFWKYDLALSNWSVIENSCERPSLIFGHTAVLHKGSMYVYGGEFKSCETVMWKYTFDSNEWERISPTSKKLMPRSRRHHSAVIYDKKMYIFGGIIDILGCTNEFWIFNLVDHSWELLVQGKNNPGARYEHSAVVYNKIMWLAGGLSNYQAKSEVWKWSFEYFTWTKVKTKGGSYAIHGHRVVKCGNAMVIFGGSINGQFDNMIRRFDFETLSWSVITPHGNVSPSPRSAPAMICLSAFSLPVLRALPTHNSPKPKFACNHVNLQVNNLVDELRPRSSPDFKSPGQTAHVPRIRHCSLSSDSLYQPPTTHNIDKRFSAISGSTDGYEDSSGVASSFTNASYASSVEGPQFFHLTKDEQQSEKTMNAGQPVDQNATIKQSKNNNGAKEKYSYSEVKRLPPTPKEGLCLFLVGGKCCGDCQFYTKSIDIWRCDVTKRRKRSSKITQINVQSAETTEWSGINAKCEQSLVREQQDLCSTFSAAGADKSSEAIALAMHGEEFKENDVMNEADETSTCYGDLILTDLGSN